MQRKIVLYTILWFFIALINGINGHIVRAETAIDIEAILVNTAPPGESGKDYNSKTGDAKQPGGLGDDLWIKINNKDILPEQAVLYLNGMAMKGNDVQGAIIIDANDNCIWLRYRLERNQENHKAWLSLLARPKSFTKEMVVSIGKEQERPIGRSAKFEFIIIPKVTFWLTAIVLVILLILFIYLARTTEIIRDRGPKAEKDKRRTYSLAFTQMAFWTFIVAMSYVFILILTGDLDTMSSSALVLIGIGAVTAVSGGSIDAGKRKTNEEKCLEDIKKLDELKAKTPQPADEIKEIQERIKRRENATKVLATGGFWDDILTDVDGAAIHRFQIIVWTIILGGIFLFKVYETLAMPQFSTELLGLMGISAGTYLGFKIPEKQTDDKT